jgi:signal transduction histidine kinase
MKLFASLHSRVILVILLASVPLLVLTLSSYAWMRAEAIKEVENDLRATLYGNLKHEEAITAQVRLLLLSIENANELDPRVHEACVDLLRRRMRLLPHLANLAVATPDGKPVCSALPGQEGINLADRRYFQQVLATRQPSEGEYVVGRISREPGIIFAQPVLDAAGAVRLVLIANLRPTWLEDVLLAANLPADWHALVIDRTGRVLARRSTRPFLDEFDAAEAERLWTTNGQQIHVHQVAIHGEIHLHGIAPLQASPDQLLLIVGATTGDAFGIIDARFRKVLAMTLLLTLFSAMIAWRSVRSSVIDGVEGLADTVERFGLGEREVRAGNLSSISELQFLATKFDAMANSVTHFNRTIEHRVAERTEDLARSNAELEAFAYSVSHDLRAPLRAIAGFGEILNDRYRGQLDAEGRRYLDNVLGAAGQMNHLIDDLLQYSRVGRGMIRKERIDLAPLLQGLLKLFQTRLAAGGRIDISEPLASPVGDPRLIGQILTNLIDNALKYQPPGQAPLVRIDSTANDSEVTIRVADNGIGVPPEQREAIFNVFQRLHGEEEYPGTGIGLAIALKAARLMAGTLTVEAAPDGQGSCFILRLPANPTAGNE